MNTLVDLLNMGLAQRIGWALIHFLWQGAAIAGLLWLALRLLARRGPRARYASACLALLLMAAAPVATFFVVQPAGQDVRKPAQTSAATYPEDDSWGKGIPLKVPAEFREGTATLEQAKGWCRALVAGSSFGNGHVIEVEHRELVPGGEQAVVVFDPSCGGSGGRGPQLIFSRTPKGLRFLGDLSGSWRAAPPDALGRPRLVGYWRLGGGEGKASLIVLTSRGFMPVAHVDASGGDGADDEKRRTWRTLFEEPVSQKTLAATFGEDASSRTSLPDMEKEPDLAAATAGRAADAAAKPADRHHWTSRVSAWAEPAMPYAVAIWLAGVLACSVWHVGGWVKVQRLRRGAQPLADGTNEGHWRAAAGRLTEALRIGHAVRLLKITGAAARDLAGPVVVGVLRPAVLIPAAVLTGLTPSQVEAVLAHELAHVRRHDYFVNLLQTLVETLLFYHPAVWWASARIRAERENCCDDLAASAVGNSHVYAAALAALAELIVAQQPTRPAGIIGRLAPALRRGSSRATHGSRSSADRITPGAKTNLLYRIRRLLGVDAGPSSRWPSALAGTILLGGLLACIAFYGCVANSASPDRRPMEPATQPADVSPEALVAVSRGEWSPAVNGLQGRLVLKRTHVTNGTPIITTYLELKNVPDLGNPMKVAWASERMLFRVADSDGRELPPFMGPFDGMGFGGHDLTLPHDSSIVFDISARGAGIPGDRAAMIDLGPTTSWVIPRDEKQYSLVGTLEIPLAASQPADGSRLWHGKIDLPAVQVPLSSPRLASDVTGRLIEELGARMIERPNTGESEAAADMLSLIDDERVIPWYVKAVAADSSQLRQRALDRLGRFESDAALEGLRIGMETQAEDVEGDTASPQVAHQAAEGVRHYAAVALARSPNPKAKDLLLTMRNDPYTGVRIVVVQTFGEMDTPKALQLLEEMSRDRDEAVRGEARRYLELRRSRSTTQPARRDVSIVNWIELVDKDDLPAGMYCQVPSYARALGSGDRLTPSAQWVYRHVRTEPLKPGMLTQMELSARLVGIFTARGTLEVAEQFVQGDTITIRLRYIDEDKDTARYMEAGNPVHVYGDKQFKAVYLWGYMPTGLLSGRYTVNLELDEYDRKDGRLVRAPFESTTRAVRRERLSCTYTVETAGAASRPATAQAGQEQSPAQHVWEDYRRALEFLFNGGGRADAAEHFEAVLRRWTSEDDHGMADEARSVARRLRAMADEDRQWKPVVDPDKLTGQARVDYLVHELRDVAVRGVIDPGETYVLSAIVMPPAGLPLDEARMPAVQLRHLGKEAVPSLLALLDDTRLTRSSDGPFNGSHILEYRDVAIQIIETIAGRQFLPINATGEYLSTTSQEKHDKTIADTKAWWEANRDRQEHEWLADALLENGIGWSSSSIAAAERLVELRGEKSVDVFRKLVAKEPDTPWPLILLHKAGGKSVLEDVRRATKSPSMRVRATAYGILRREGDPGVVELALADLAALKEMPETKGFGNALLEFLAGCGDDGAALAVAKLMLSPDKHVVIDARAATLQANPADKITPERLRLILPYVAATLDNQALELGYHHMTAEWIIKAARLAIDWPQDPAGYDQALQKVRTWWREHKGDYPPATAPSAASRPAIEQFIDTLDAAFNLSPEPDDAFLWLVQQAIEMEPHDQPQREGWGQRPTGLDFGRLLEESGQAEALASFPLDHREWEDAVAALVEGRKAWVLAALLNHENVDAKIRAARGLEKLAEPRAAAALLAAAKANDYPVEGSERATVHMNFRRTLKRALEKITGQQLTPRGLRFTTTTSDGRPQVITSDEHPEEFGEEVDFAKVEAWLRAKYLSPTSQSATQPASAPSTNPVEAADLSGPEDGLLPGGDTTLDEAMKGPVTAVVACQATQPVRATLGHSGVVHASQVFRLDDVIYGEHKSATTVNIRYSYLQPGMGFGRRDRAIRANEKLVWVLHHDGFGGERGALALADTAENRTAVKRMVEQLPPDLADKVATARAEARMTNRLFAIKPAGWRGGSMSSGKVQPTHWDAGQGMEFVWRTLEDRPEFKLGRAGQVTVWVMEAGYSGKRNEEAVRNAQAAPAQEIATWRGRRVFFWGGGDDWPTAKADIHAALKATDAPAAETQPATKPVMSNLAKRVTSSMPSTWQRTGYARAMPMRWSDDPALKAEDFERISFRHKTAEAVFPPGPATFTLWIAPKNYVGRALENAGVVSQESVPPRLAWVGQGSLIFVDKALQQVGQEFQPVENLLEALGFADWESGDITPAASKRIEVIDKLPDAQKANKLPGPALPDALAAAMVPRPAGFVVAAKALGHPTVLPHIGSTAHISQKFQFEKDGLLVGQGDVRFARPVNYTVNMDSQRPVTRGQKVLLVVARKNPDLFALAVLPDTPKQRKLVREVWADVKEAAQLSAAELVDAMVSGRRFGQVQFVFVRPVFREKIRGLSPRQREKLIRLLADEVAILQGGKQWETRGTLHDRHHLLFCLGDLRAREALAEILRRHHGADCCAAPALIDAFVSCAKREDAWLLASKFETMGFEDTRLKIHEGLRRLTGLDVTGGEGADSWALAGLWSGKLAQAGIGQLGKLYFVWDSTTKQIVCLKTRQGILRCVLTMYEKPGMVWSFLPDGKEAWKTLDLQASMSQLSQASVSPDGKHLVLVTRGEGHPILDVLDWPRVLSGRRVEPKLSVDPYPGWIETLAFREGKLAVRSDAPLDDPKWREASTSQRKLLPRSHIFLLDPAKGTFTRAE